MNKVLLTVSIMVAFIGSLLAQESPITRKAGRVKITEGPEIALTGGYLTVIRWTVNNPGGLPVHYGVVHYGNRRCSACCCTTSRRRQPSTTRLTRRTPAARATVSSAQ